jgi:hypothetical protein
MHAQTEAQHGIIRHRSVRGRSGKPAGAPGGRRVGVVEQFARISDEDRAEDLERSTRPAQGRFQSGLGFSNQILWAGHAQHPRNCKAEGLHRLRNQRRHPAPGRHERRRHDRRHQLRPQCPDLRRGPFRDWVSAGDAGGWARAFWRRRAAVWASRDHRWSSRPCLDFPGPVGTIKQDSKWRTE